MDGDFGTDRDLVLYAEFAKPAIGQVHLTVRQNPQINSATKSARSRH
jgi:hypothetical protein